MLDRGVDLVLPWARSTTHRAHLQSFLKEHFKSLARLHARSGHMAEAERRIEQALGVMSDAECPELLILLARVRRSAGNFEGARAAAERAAKLGEVAKEARTLLDQIAANRPSP